MAVALNNKKLQDLVVEEFRMETNAQVKYYFAKEMAKWDAPPKSAVKYLFEALKDFPITDSIQHLNTIFYRLPKIAVDQPIDHLALYNDLVEKTLIGARSDGEFAAAAKITTQLAKWSGDAYDKILQLHRGGELSDARFASFINVASYEVNATTGSLLESIPQRSRDSFFNLIRGAKESESPIVRSAAAEVIYRQRSKKFTPQDLKYWLSSELPADRGAQTQLKKLYSDGNSATKKYMRENLPEIFAKNSSIVDICRRLISFLKFGS